MKILHACFISIVAMVIFSSCSKEEQHEPISNNTTPPGIVSQVVVKTGPGQATISYVLPTDKDLSYVKAVYTLSSGVQREVKASYYTNTLTVDGFGDTLQHEVKLYAVNKSEVESAPVTVTVRPMENPIWEVFRNLNVRPDFGGLRIATKNPFRANVAIQIMVDSVGDWVPYTGIYTQTDSINKGIKGLDTIPKKFALFVRDRFLNHTDTLFTTIKPLYETPLSKSLYKAMSLPGDAAIYWSSNKLSNLWDGDIMNWPNVAISDPSVLTPQWWTIDLGQTAQLSRLVIWDYPEYLTAARTYYYAGNPKNLEIWGSNNPPADGSWTNWTLLGSFEEVKPSGSAYGTQTDEDYQTAYAGFSWDLRVDVPKMRYIRIKCLKNWSGSTYLGLSEIQAYGDPR